MFILVLLLSCLSLPTALLKPTTAKGGLANNMKEEEQESRFKRQTAFFELLHQTLEKYANCDDEQLDNLKAVAHPQQFSCSTEDTSSDQNNTPLKCTKVNLCSLQNYHAPPPASSWDSKATNANQNYPPYFLANKPPASSINHYTIGNMPLEFNSKHSIRNNFTYFPLNPAILSSLLYRPGSSEHKPLLTASLESTTETKTTQIVPINNCSCLVVDTQKTTTELPAPQKPENATTADKTENCSCEKAVENEITATNTAEAAVAAAAATATETETKTVASKHPNDASNESAASNQNLDLLFQQLDEMACSVNDHELKEILEKLKTYKTAFEININEKNCTPNSNASTTASSSSSSAHPQVEVTEDSRESSKNQKIDITHSEPPVNNPTDVQPVNSSNASHNVPSVTEIESTFSHDPTFENNSNDTAKTIIINRDVQELKDKMKILMSSINNKNAQKDSSESSRGETRGQLVASNNNATDTNSREHKTISNIYDQLNSIRNNSNSDTSPQSINNNSKITISIISNGNFKNIHVEHSDKHLEIKEKEKVKAETSQPKSQSLDMMGTDSRHVNIIKQPQMKAPYAEPILSEIYSSRSNFRTKPPLTIYWHKIEEKPSKLKRIPSEVLKDFKSFGINHMESKGEENLPIMGRREGIDY